MKIFFCFSLIFTSIFACNKKWEQTIFHEEPVHFKKDTISPAPTDSLQIALTHFHLPYQMEEPAQRFVMPKKLNEISGLSMTPSNENVLTAIQDEEGIIFHINKNTGEVEKEITFYKDGDYEGVEVVGDTVYVVKSTGTIYEVSDLELSPPYVKKHKFFLDKENDVEGLCYDSKNNRLLIACKGMPITEQSEEENKFQKAVYSFDLKEHKMELTPTFIFSLTDLQSYLKNRVALANHDKLCSYFNPEVESLIFSPSAIAVHPITGNIYMTSSAKKILMVFDPMGKILHLEKMDKSVHPQPEGLAFDEDGTLYVANEGKDGDGTILKFTFQPELAKH